MDYSGLKAAADRGRVGGKQKAVTFERLAKARRLIADVLEVREAAARLKIGKAALYDALKSE